MRPGSCVGHYPTTRRRGQLTSGAFNVTTLDVGFLTIDPRRQVSWRSFRMLEVVFVRLYAGCFNS